MPEYIGPELRMARPRTTPTSQIRSKSRIETEDGEDQIELLEYEWPDLPPIMDMKDAVTRKRVSKGISYLLPVDKGKNSINSNFRTDLRAMFHEPYATEYHGYEDTKVTLSAKVHFDVNAVDTKWNKKHLMSVPINVNSESEKARKLYAQSAPAGGRAIDEEKLRIRSNLYLPLKKTAHPEAVKLRKEVEGMVKSILEKDGSEIGEHDIDSVNSTEGNIGSPTTTENKMTFRRHRSFVSSTGKSDISIRNRKLKLTAVLFDSYEQLKKTQPPKPTIPAIFQSEYLSNDKSQRIWEWLHYGEEVTPFQYFLSVCGFPPMPKDEEKK
ncbi:hypothetical protein CHS0354_041185 [Potamilus streckersoni]|uniref:Uncharacterized protein n=1 Tax=Potamilus streckersoni TaxID=2493646 RepID=A0AAE0SED2_9BIVA|nr:hypothetical protein CHS0354_041185 [Potamilus streckersoni]